MPWKSIFETAFGVTAIVSAFVGGFVGVFVDRLCEYWITRPLFRISFTHFDSMDGYGINVNVENAGFAEIHEYKVALFHPRRGQMVADSDKKTNVFPQQPAQSNEFCWWVLAPDAKWKPPEDTRFEQPYMHYWITHEPDKEVVVPRFDEFTVQLILRNSDRVLLESSQLGSNIAKHIFEICTKSKTSQVIDDITYISKAPFPIELWRRRRDKRARRISVQ